MKHRLALTLAVAATLGGCATTAERQPGLMLAITIDDLPLHGQIPAGYSPRTVSQRLIDALAAADAPATGFINGHWTEQQPETALVLEDWRRAGLELANHGWAHRHLSEISLAEFEAELARNEPLLARFGRDWRWFRYPYLDRGETEEKRAAARAILARRGYRIAAVTMDFSDWAWTAPYARCAAANDQAGIAALERAYLDAARQGIAYYRALSRGVHEGDIPYVLVLHSGAMTARMMPRLLALYRDAGFRFTTLGRAQRHPAYRTDNDPTLPQESGLEDRARSARMPLPQRTDVAPMLEAICR